MYISAEKLSRTLFGLLYSYSFISLLAITNFYSGNKNLITEINFSMHCIVSLIILLLLLARSIILYSLLNMLQSCITA